jgi:hypothetical protein
MMKVKEPTSTSTAVEEGGAGDLSDPRIVLFEQVIPPPSSRRGVDRRQSFATSGGQSFATRAYDRGKKGYLDDDEKLVRKYDANGDGQIDVSEVFKIVEDVREEKAQKVKYKKFMIWAVLFSFVVLAANFALTWAVVISAQQAQTANDNLVDSSTGNIVATRSRGSHIVSPLRGNSPTTIIATAVKSFADAHIRILSPYTDLDAAEKLIQAKLAVQSGAALVFTSPATEITKGNVCAHSSFTGLPGPDLDYVLESGASASLGGCDPNDSLFDFLTDAMAKNPKTIPEEMGGKTFYAGTYFAAAINIAANTDVILLGDQNSVFLFQSGATMNTGENTTFILNAMDPLNGNTASTVQAKNILFALTAAATTGAGSFLEGSILAGAAVTLGAASHVSGYVLAGASISVGAECFLNSASIGPSVDDTCPSPIANLIDAAKCFDDGSDVGQPSFTVDACNY